MGSETDITPSPAPEKTADSLLATVRDLAAELRPGQVIAEQIQLDSVFDRDIGLDSLARLELVGRIEEIFDVSLSERVITEAETPRDLLRAVSKAGGRTAIAPTAPAAQLPPTTAAAPPAAALTLTDVLDHYAAATPDRRHIRLYSDEGEGEIITYGDLKVEAESIAAGLQQRGLEPGQSVSIMLPTGRDYFRTFFGVLLAGGVPVPIYPPARMTQIEEHLNRHVGILDNCQAVFLVCPPEAKKLALLLRGRVPSLEGALDPDELAQAPGQLIRPVIKETDTAFVQYTSGSTGAPKGVVLTHANLLANIRAMGSALKANSDDVFVSWLPLYHDMGLIGAWFGSMYYAAELVIMPPLMFLARPERWLRAIERFGGTMSAAPNFGYEFCLRRINAAALEGLDLSTWRIACNGAEAVSAETVDQFCDRFAAYRFQRESMMPVYGLAENSVGLAFPPLERGPLIDRIKRAPLLDDGRAIPADDDDVLPMRIPSCGLAIPGHQIRIADAAGRELPDRIEGRIQFKGPSATSGYLHNPEKTGDLFDGDWLDTGDRGYIVEGEVYVTGRTKDIIIRAGRNIYPDGLEEAVGKIEAIRKGNVAVFASRDDKTGTERLVVLAETRRHDTKSRERLTREINRICTDMIGTPPDDVALAPPNTVAKTSSGKIRRSSCREIYEKGMIGKSRSALQWQLLRLGLVGAASRLRRAVPAFGGFLFAAWGWMLFGLLSPLLWAGVVALPSERLRWPFLRHGLKLLARLTGTPLRLHGVENLPPKDAPCLIVSNHASYLDGFVLTALLDRPLRFIAKRELTGHWAPRLALDKLGTQYVERFDPKKSLEDAARFARLAKADNTLLFFPEGTFTRMSGVLPFHLGAFTTAVEARVPVVPVVIRGTRSILRSESWFPRRGVITVTVGAPISPPDSGDNWKDAIALRDETRAFILKHAGEPDLGGETALSRPPKPSES